MILRNGRRPAGKPRQSGRRKGEGNDFQESRIRHPRGEDRLGAGFAIRCHCPKDGVLFIARIETIVTAIQNNDLIISAPMVRLSNAPPPIT